MDRQLLTVAIFIVLMIDLMTRHVLPPPAPNASTASPVVAVESALTTDSTHPENTATYYQVTKVVDGDTLAIDMGDKRVTIRLIGLDTPETVDPRKPVQCFGEEASRKAKELLAGKSIRLETDPSQGERDKYGRLLAYVYLEDGTLFNKFMIAEGYGHQYTYNLPYKYQAEFKEAERQARAEKKGLWAPDACAGFQASAISAQVI